MDEAGGVSVPLKRGIRVRIFGSDSWAPSQTHALALLLLLAGGCLLPPRAPLEVSDSQLNWLSIRHRPAPADAPPSRIEIIGAGYIERNGQQYLVRVPGQVADLDALRRIVLDRRDGVPIRVGDVAEVGEGPELRTGAATQNGVPFASILDAVP